MIAGYRLFLLDVEGTVAPISLVTRQLFPYARIHFAEFLRKSVGNARVDADLTLLAEENCAESDVDCPAMPSVPDRASETWKSSDSFRGAALDYLLWLMDRDRKSTALKSLQGKIWKAGFEAGELKGTLFADVPEAFTRWSSQGKVAIYSSGSVEAQQLLFRHSIFGDLTPLISSYFDTRTGPKTASASYAAIAAAAGVAPGEALFFSDVLGELDAAREAGLATRLVVREGNVPVADAHGHSAVESLALI
jgi:enolase-phosphatase E1